MVFEIFSGTEMVPTTAAHAVAVVGKHTGSAAQRYDTPIGEAVKCKNVLFFTNFLRFPHWYPHIIKSNLNELNGLIELNESVGHPLVQSVVSTVSRIPGPVRTRETPFFGKSSFWGDPGRPCENP